MRDELTQAELNREFYGPAPRIEATFYDHEVTDVPASKAAGHRVRKNATYIHLVCRKENVETRRPAMPEDRKRFRTAWEAYQEKGNAESDAGHCEVPDLQQIKAGIAG